MVAVKVVVVVDTVMTGAELGLLRDVEAPADDNAGDVLEDVDALADDGAGDVLKVADEVGVELVLILVVVVTVAVTTDTELAGDVDEDLPAVLVMLVIGDAVGKVW